MGAGGPPVRVHASVRNSRYVYLVGRLNNRQITMEEASELFSIMQEMLQASEAARLALSRIPPPPRRGAAPAEPAAPSPAASGGGGDDLLLVGLLAIGAGAGLIAAMTKRFQEATTPGGPAPGSPPNSDA
jgi:hypothetical protein